MQRRFNDLLAKAGLLALAETGRRALLRSSAAALLRECFPLADICWRRRARPFQDNLRAAHDIVPPKCWTARIHGTDFDSRPNIIVAYAKLQASRRSFEKQW